MRLIAHRGASGYEPENTLRAFERALDLGATWMELDVHRSDDHLLVIHDDDLNRTTNGTGSVSSRSFDYIRSLDAGCDEQVPTLREVLALVDGRAGLNIELKGLATAELAVEQVREAIHGHWSLDQFLLSSFDHLQLRQVYAMNPDLKIGALFKRYAPRKVQRAVDLNAATLNVPVASVSPKLVRQAHKAGLGVLVYTVNDVVTFDHVRSVGVDGVFTDYLDRLHQPVRR